MNNAIQLECYIQEYHNANNALCVRLRDKKSNRIVSLTGENLDKQHFLLFLSQAKSHMDLMPTIYDQDGTDIVIVTGILVKVDESEVVLDVNCVGGGYQFA